MGNSDVKFKRVNNEYDTVPYISEIKTYFQTSGFRGFLTKGYTFESKTSFLLFSRFTEFSFLSFSVFTREM